MDVGFFHLVSWSVSLRYRPRTWPKRLGSLRAPFSIMVDEDHNFVSRGGLKMAHALSSFDLDATGLTAADLGCSTGGFTDCLLQNGAAHVYAVDTAYGELAWKLRQDERVTVMERSNALHTEPAAEVDWVVIDLGWTKQERALPVAAKWLRDSSEARVVTLIKPHYESGIKKISDEQAAEVTADVLKTLPGMGFEVLGHVPSPIKGGKGKNLEFLALLKRLG